MNDIYNKLVDLYAGSELSEELEQDLESYAAQNPSVKDDITSLKSTVERLRNTKGAEFTEESNQRILMQIYARGGKIETRSPEPAFFQYHLPISS
jgi:hypothetical protein